MKNIPKVIYLQTGIEQYGESCEDFNELDNISWYVDKIYGDDLQFISVDSILARIKELEAEIDNEYSNESEMSCMFKINELKRLIEWK